MPHRPDWTSRNLLRVAAVAAAAFVFALLTLLVRMRWLPMETVDAGVAAGLNADIAPHPAWVRAMGFISRLGSFGVRRLAGDRAQSSCSSSGGGTGSPRTWRWPGSGR